MLVRRRQWVSPDTVSFELVPVEPDAKLPPFSAGAHVAVVTPSGAVR